VLLIAFGSAAVIALSAALVKAGLLRAALAGRTMNA